MKNKNKNILIYGIVLLMIIMQINFLLGEEISFSEQGVSETEEGVKVNTQGDVKWEISEDGKELTLFFTKKAVTDKETFVEINGVKYENILPADKSLHPSYIKLDSLGNILEADLTADEKGGYYLVNGVSVSLDKNERIYYNKKENKYYPSEGSSISGDSSALEKGFYVKGQKVHLPGTILNGEASVDKKGYLITSGTANLGEIKISVADEPVLIALPSYALKNYVGNWIKSSQGVLEMKSSKTGTIDLEFLKGSWKEVEKNDKFSVKLMKGDGLKIQRTTLGGLNLPKITHKSSETGNTLIENNGFDFKLNNEELIIDSESVKVESLLSGRYESVESFIDSDSVNIKEQILIDNFGEAKAFYANPSKIEYVYRSSNLLDILRIKQIIGEDGLKKIAQSLKDNGKDSADRVLSDLSYELFDSTNEASRLGFKKDEITDLIAKTIEISGDESLEGITGLKGALNEFSYYKNAEKKYSKDQIKSFILTTNKKIKEKGDLNDLNYIYGDLLRNAVESNIDLNLAGEFTDKMIESGVITKKGVDYSFYPRYSASLKEYNGKNYEDIKKGVEIAGKYDVDLIIFKELGLSYTDVDDKQTLAKNYASAINNYIEKGKKDPSLIYRFVDDINEMHDIEEQERKDEIRETIIKDLSFKAKYNLISQSEEAYFSTFDKVYSSLPSNFVKQIKQIDQKGENFDNFAFQVASRGKLNDLLEQDPIFVKDFIKRELSTEDKEKLVQTAVFATNTMDRFYEDPKYQNEKKDLENFLIENYNKAKTKEQKATYGYLLKSNEKFLTEEAKKISKGLPEINSDLVIPKRYSDKKEIGAKLYFYDDESSFSESQKEFKEKYKMDLIKTKKNEAILTKKIGEKTIKIVLELVPANDVPKNKEVIENDRFILAGHRGHSFHLDQTFSEGSYTDKILFFGSCGSYTRVPEMQEKYPKAQIICDKDKGEGWVNNAVVYEIIKSVAEGKKSWKELDSSFAEENGLIFPDDKLMLLRKYIMQF